MKQLFLVLFLGQIPLIYAQDSAQSSGKCPMGHVVASGAQTAVSNTPTTTNVSDAGVKK